MLGNDNDPRGHKKISKCKDSSRPNFPRIPACQAQCFADFSCMIQWITVVFRAGLRDRFIEILQDTARAPSASHWYQRSGWVGHQRLMGNQHQLQSSNPQCDWFTISLSSKNEVCLIGAFKMSSPRSQIQASAFLELDCVSSKLSIVSECDNRQVKWIAFECMWIDWMMHSQICT